MVFLFSFQKHHALSAIFTAPSVAAFSWDGEYKFKIFVIVIASKGLVAALAPPLLLIFIVIARQFH